VLLIISAAVLPIACAGQTGSNTLWLSSQTESERIAHVENGIPALEVKGQPPIQLTLQQWMEKLGIPGLSVAVFDHGKLLWAKTYGVKQTNQKSPVTLDTLFQAGSISKPVTALAVMHYVQMGKFNLDENINDKLISWKVPDNEFTKDQKVTLRRIMSHSAGLTVHGFGGYGVTEKIPTLVQVLNGEPPANSPPVRVEMVPGTKNQYSGGGTTIMQLMIVDQLKKPFPEIMRETVIEPLGLKNSTYQQPLPPDRAAKAASANGKDTEGKWHIYPEMAAAGLWTTASDLAQVAMEVSAAKAGQSHKVVSQETVKQMLTVQSAPFGLGFMADGKTDQFGHDGSDWGFQASLTGFSDRGSGMAIMANSDMGFALFARLTESAAKEYGWAEFHHETDPLFLKLFLVARMNGLPQALESYRAMRDAGPPSDYNPGDLNALGYMLLQSGDIPGSVKVFEENVKIYPEDANAYDSLGEAYAAAGRKDEAIANYKKSLEMNPKNDNAVKRLKTLGVNVEQREKK